MAKFVKGDVVVVPFPFSNLSQAKRRPALVVVDLEGDDIILCQITSQLNKDKYSIIVNDNDFKEGKINVLVATSIGEEGLDIPEVNAVIFYEPVPSAIRKIQRQGRTARLMPGKLVILITRKTRDESYHYASLAKERKMHGILRDLSENFRKKSSKNIRQKGINEFV